MELSQIFTIVGNLLKYITWIIGFFLIVRAIIDIPIANANQNPNAKDEAYMKLGAGVVLVALGAIIPTLIDQLMPTDINLTGALFKQIFLP